MRRIRALEIARAAGVTTILNPAPAAALPDSIYALCDYVTPNETEAEGITGIAGRRRRTMPARRPTRCWRKGVGAVVVTLGEKGALLHTADGSDLVPAYNVGPVVETTGAGDAFNGGFAVGLSRGFAADRRRALRLRRRRHLGHAAGHRAVDADARRGDGGLRGGASVARSQRRGRPIATWRLVEARPSPHAAR